MSRLETVGDKDSEIIRNKNFSIPQSDVECTLHHHHQHFQSHIVPNCSLLFGEKEMILIYLI